MDNFDRKKYLYYSEKWKGDFPKKNPTFKKELNSFQPNHKEVKKLEEEFIDEFTKENADWVKKRRLEFLDGELKRINKKIISGIEQANCYESWFFVTIYKAFVEPFKKEWEKVYREIQMYKNPKFVELQEISDEDIEKAKNYPIENLIEVNKEGFALCLFHDDHHPSMYCRKNYYYCFSCNASGSTIDLYMYLNNVNFIEAVRFLSNN